MEIYLAYRFTGEDYKTLQKTLAGICDALTKAGYEVYCSINDDDFFRQNNYSTRQILDHELVELSKADRILAFIDSDNRSEGLLIELGYALAKGKPIILAVRKGVNIHTSSALADQLIEFDNYEHLNQLIGQLELR